MGVFELLVLFYFSKLASETLQLRVNPGPFLQRARGPSLLQCRQSGRFLTTRQPSGDVVGSAAAGLPGEICTA